MLAKITAAANMVRAGLPDPRKLSTWLGRIPDDAKTVADLKCELLAASHPRSILSGVYFLFAGGELVYVGQSVNVFVRLAAHMREKDFDRWSYVLCGRDELDTLETRFIKAFRPPLNIARVPRSPGGYT